MPRFGFTRSNIIRLAVLAGVLYSSWPLAYVLNPAIAQTAFASKFEAANQPYNWLFVLLDTASAIILLLLGCLQWRKTDRFILRISIASYGVFALLVIVAALAQYDCSSFASRCMDIGHVPYLSVHGLASIVSVGALFLSMISLAPLLKSRLRSAVGIILSSLVFGWCLCGVATLIYAHTTFDVMIQYVFITLCSASVIATITLNPAYSDLSTSEELRLLPPADT